MRYAYKVTNGRKHDIRCVGADWKLDPDEIEGFGDELPLADPLPASAPTLTLDDIKSVLTSEQQKALDAKLVMKKTGP